MLFILVVLSVIFLAGVWEIHKSKKEKKRKQEENEALLQEAKKAFEDFCEAEEYVDFFSTREGFMQAKREWEERLDDLQFRHNGKNLEIKGKAFITGIKNQKRYYSPANAEETFFGKVLKSCEVRIDLRDEVVEFRLQDGSLFVKTIKDAMVVWGAGSPRMLDGQQRLKQIVRQYAYNLLSEKKQEEKAAMEEFSAKYLQDLAESAEAARQEALDAYLGERDAGE